MASDHAAFSKKLMQIGFSLLSYIPVGGFHNHRPKNDRRRRRRLWVRAEGVGRTNSLYTSSFTLQLCLRLIGEWFRSPSTEHASWGFLFGIHFLINQHRCEMLSILHVHLSGAFFYLLGMEHTKFLYCDPAKSILGKKKIMHRVIV